MKPTESNFEVRYAIVYLVGFDSDLYHCKRPDDTKVTIFSTLAEAQKSVEGTVLGILKTVFQRVTTQQAVVINQVSRAKSEAMYNNRPLSQVSGKITLNYN